MTLLYFLPIVFVIAVIYGTLRRETLQAILLETVKLFFIISLCSAVGSLLIFLLVRSL